MDVCGEKWSTKTFQPTAELLIEIFLASHLDSRMSLFAVNFRSVKRSPLLGKLVHSAGSLNCWWIPPACERVGFWRIKSHRKIERSPGRG
jgi:hypothetical protein